MLNRATALQSALVGMTVAHNRVASAAQSLAKLQVAFSSPSTRGAAPAGSQTRTTEPMSTEMGRGLVELHESLAQARTSSATAGAAQAMLDGLLEIGRR